MSHDDLQDFRDEGCNPERNVNLEASAAAVKAWERDHPWSLDDFIEFLSSFQRIFCEFPVRRDVWVGSDFRL